MAPQVAYGPDPEALNHSQERAALAVAAARETSLVMGPGQEQTDGQAIQVTKTQNKPGQHPSSECKPFNVGVERMGKKRQAPVFYTVVHAFG